jgi:NAD(P)-dependent dehydrogenase (short-subunit alcohol dehydrogenase family)
MRLRGRAAIVTGGGAGVGRATALRFAHEGAGVAVSDIDEGAARAVAAEIEAAGGSALAMRADAASIDESRALVAAAVERFGALQILVNNAGLPSQYAQGSELERWDLGIEQTLSSAYRTTSLVLPELIRAGGGAIVNICSISGNRVALGPAWYASAKAGLAGLTRSLAASEGRHGIRVNALCLGVIATQRTRFIREDPAAIRIFEDRTPRGRIGTPEEVAAAALFLASDDASLITGQVLIADAGFTVT